MNRILFCTNVPLVKELGAAKVIVELAEEMSRIGWHCDLTCPSDYAISDSAPKSVVESQFHARLRTHLLEHADEYDVIDYDHEHLPFPRAQFSRKALFVARSVLLVHHLASIAIPTRGGLKGAVGQAIREPGRRRERLARVARAQKIVADADLVNVSNDDDRAELIRCGIEPGKIVAIPYGIGESRRKLFDQIASDVPSEPLVAFVGTFDYRKGAREFPRIVDAVCAAVPNVRFRFLGTRGMFRTEGDVRAHFPRALQGRLDIVPSFKPNDLPELLAQCSAGVFPSYIEGMPFGVLEMMAASAPVVAYSSPGLSMLVGPEFLAPRGDAAALADRLIALLSDPSALHARRIAAKAHSQEFTWRRSAAATSRVYLEEIAKRQ